MAVQNSKYGAIILLPVPFEAVFVRINPTSWENSIALTVEFFGCNLNQPYTPGMAYKQSFYKNTANCRNVMATRFKSHLQEKLATWLMGKPERHKKIA